MLANLGVATRANCRALLRDGRVTVGGALARDPAMQVAQEDVICLDGRALDTRLTRHGMLYKPAGVLTAAEDARQPTVMALLPPVCRALGCMPVGRLDKDTTGILIFTTDGELAHRLTLRYTPELVFVLDDSISHGVHISEMLSKLNIKDGDESDDGDGR